MGLKIYTPRRSRGEVNKWLRRIKSRDRRRRRRLLRILRSGGDLTPGQVM